MQRERHALNHPYTFWFFKRSNTRNQENYERNIKNLFTVDSVEKFWQYYSHMERPNKLANTADYNMFKTGIKPMWEDEANRRGGKWVLRLKKGLATKFWEDLVLAVIGNQFPDDHDICGIGISVRYHEDILSVWNRNAQDPEAKQRVVDTLRKVLDIDMLTPIEYKTHDESIDALVQTQF